MFKIAKKEKLDLITFISDVTDFPKSFTLVASKLKIKTIVIQHGIIGQPIGYVPCYSERFAAWGERSKEILKEYGMPLEKIVITGTPRFDKYIKIKKNQNLRLKIKDSVYEAFGIDKSKKLILLTTSYVEFDHLSISLDENQLDIEKMFTCILKTFKQIPNSHLIIKLHPTDSYEFISKEIIKSMNVKNVSVITNYKIENLLSASDCVIITNSGTGLEAMIVERPIIRLRLKKNEYECFKSEKPIYKEVFDCDKLQEAIQQVLNHPNPLKENQKLHLMENFYKLDGNSTKRVYNFIIMMLSQ